MRVSPLAKMRFSTAVAISLAISAATSASAEVGGGAVVADALAHPDGFAHPGPSVAVEDVGFGRLGVSRFDEHLLNQVLDFLDAGDVTFLVGALNEEGDHRR